MAMLRLLRAACLALASLTLSAQAAEPKGPWAHQATRQPPKGDLEYCAAEAPYDNGYSLLVLRRASGETTIAVGLPDKRFPEGGAGKIAVSIDDLFKSGADTAFQVDKRTPDLMFIPLGKDRKLPQAIAKGNKLTVRGEATTLDFSLKGSAKMMEELRQCLCVSNREEAEGFRALRVMLETSGLRGFEFLPVDKNSPILADILWAYGEYDADCKLKPNQGLLGGLYELKLTETAEFGKAVDQYVAGMKNRCETPFTDPQTRQTFSAGVFGVTKKDVVKHDTVTLQSMEYSCKADGVTRISPILMASDGKVMSIFFHLPSEANVPLARRYRDQIADLLRRLKPEPAAAGN